MNKDGKYARQLGFDQTQTMFNHLLDDGRIIYTRRDYNDRGQSFGHALFVMNPDGTHQTEYYGNNSMLPTSIQHTRQIPGTKKTMGIGGGYHTSQGGNRDMLCSERVLRSIPGMIVTVQTFGELPRWHPHVHAIVTDGVFTPKGSFIPFLEMADEPFLKLFNQGSHEISTLLAVITILPFGELIRWIFSLRLLNIFPKREHIQSTISAGTLINPED